jgi:hypothetical protein
MWRLGIVGWQIVIVGRCEACACWSGVSSCSYTIRLTRSLWRIDSERFSLEMISTYHSLTLWLESLHGDRLLATHNSVDEAHQ